MIKADNISFTYENEQGQKSVIRDFSLLVEKGEFLSILGPSGCGKSTLLRLLSGFFKPDKGSVDFDGVKISAPFSQGQMVFQDSQQLLPWLTVEKNILFSRYRSLLFLKRKKISADDEILYEELLQTTGLSDYRNYLPNQLSGGLKQRVSLARAIFARPQILFLDEPFVSLDAPSRYELQTLLLKLWKSGGWTVFFVTHDISEALILSDRLLVFTEEDQDWNLYRNELPYPRDHHSELFRKENLRFYSMIDSLK